MIPEENLLNFFAQTSVRGSPIRLLNIYKGLPISYDAIITVVRDGWIQISTNKYQIACLYMDRSTNIICEEIAGSVWAQVTKLNLSGAEAILDDFQYSKIDISKRTQIRVQPDEPVRVTLQLKNSISAIDVLLADISPTGMGVYLDRNLFHPKLFQPGTEINITIYLPDINSHSQQANTTFRPPDALVARFSRERIWGLLGSETKYDIPVRQTKPDTSRQVTTGVRSIGRIMNVRPELNLNRYRIGVKLRFEDRAQFIISQFVSQRQSEIIREIKLLYDLLNKFEN